MRELFLATFKGVPYGIWKDEILAVRGLDALHRIPLTPACIAGIMMEDGQSVTLADLPVCIGHDATSKDKQGCILLKEGEHKTLGFVVSGELQTLPISPAQVLPLPDYLKTSVFDTCAIHDGVPIPLINLTELHGRALNPENTADDVREAHTTPNRDIQAIKRFRLFTAGGERYAAPDEGLEQAAITHGTITPLPNTPRYLRGVGFCNGRLLSVIDLGQRLKIPLNQSNSAMLIAKTDVGEFGFLVDSDEGDCSANEVTVMPAPAIVQTHWLRHLLVREARLIPLVDLAATLKPGSLTDEQPVWQRYTPASAFPDHFFRQAVDVQVFTLLGELYALPKMEVEEVIPFQPCRPVPDTLPIVIGITEYKGEILPVVDLAMMFGRRSLATPEWRMMLVNNGDFRALVLTESMAGEMHLSPEIHRTMPIHLPHHLIYGCYPDGIAARVILNVAAIVMHFDRSLIQGFMPSLSEKMRQSTSAEIYAFPDGPHEVPADISNIHQPTEAATRQTPPIISTPQEESSEGTQPDITELSDSAPSEISPSEVVSPEDETYDAVVPEPVTTAPTQPVEETGSPSQPTFVEPPVSTADAQSPTSATEFASASTVPEAQNNSLAERCFPQASRIDDQQPDTKRGSLAFWLIAVLLTAALVLFIIPADKTDVARPKDMNEDVKETSSPPAKSAPSISAPSRIEPIAKRDPIIPQHPVVHTSEPLVLEIPASMPIEAELYIVKQGDTLWSISQRLTGNPYNYPRIAGSNNIANPDLIFPGQQIRLTRKE